MAPTYRKNKKQAWRAKRKPTKKRAAAKTSLATQVVSAIGGYALKRLKQKLGLNTETKYVDTVSSGTTFSTTATGNQALSNFSTLVPQGLTDNTRQGNEFRMTRFCMKGFITNGAANLNNTVCRVIVVNWGKTPVAATSVADVLEVTTDINSGYTMDPSYPRTILDDRIINLGNSTVAPPANLHTYEFDYRPLSHHVRYTTTDTTGALSACVEGYIQAYIICTLSTAANYPLLTVYNRMEYVDN